MSKLERKDCLNLYSDESSSDENVPVTTGLVQFGSSSDASGKSTQRLFKINSSIENLDLKPLTQLTPPQENGFCCLSVAPSRRIDKDLRREVLSVQEPKQGLLPPLVIKTRCSMVKFETSEKYGSKEVAIKLVGDAVLAANEITALEALGHLTNIPVLLDHYTIDPADANGSCKQTALVFPVYKEFNRKRQGMTDSPSQQCNSDTFIITLDLYQIATNFKQIVLLLEQVHRAGFTHLDISPNNFMIDPTTGKIILIDFGLARRIGEEHDLGCGTSGYRCATSRKLDINLYILCCRFIAPEVYSSKITTSASDIYSTGILLGQLLEPYVPGISLHYLGSALVRHTTTSFICGRIKEITSSKLNDEFGWKPIIYDAADLLYKMLQLDPALRISASEILRHPFFTKNLNHFKGFDFESHSKKLLLRPISSVARNSRKDPLVLYRS